LDPTVKIGNGGTPETLEEVVIRVEGLRKSYGEVVAVNGMNLTVNRGEVFGILGPNGAGKSTTLETIEGLRKPDAGEIEVAGYDAVRESEDLKRIIGVQLQSTALFDYRDRGLGPLKRALLGSVSSSVVRHAYRSVLVVREEE
jgi:ABC-2 type transport system ATP-binding protein